MSEEKDLMSGLSEILSLISTDDAEDTPPSLPSQESPLDLDMIMKLGSVFSELNQEDERSRLLNDLKPFLSNDKKGKVDRAVQLLKLARIAEKLGGEKLI
jgi:hypothetical protein